MPETKIQLEDWLDDLCVRFIINLPQEELESVERICFQVEEAQWFYEDFIRPLDPSLPSMSLRTFCLRIFQHCPLLSSFSEYHHATAFSEFLNYKTRVPVRGAIMLNEAMDQVVLVKGWKKNANWSFPRGKINKDEPDLDCAVREVYEETGFDIAEAGLVTDEEHMKAIEITLREQNMRLYVFRGVPMDTHFEPRTRKEISKIQWHRLSELPTFKKSKQQQQAQETKELAINANKFYMVAPFLVPLKKWIAQQKKVSQTTPSKPQHVAPAYEAEEMMTEDEPATETDIEPFIHHAGHGANSGHPEQPQPGPSASSIEDASSALKRLLRVKDASSEEVPGPSYTHHQQISQPHPQMFQHPPPFVQQPLLVDPRGQQANSAPGFPQFQPQILHRPPQIQQPAVPPYPPQVHNSLPQQHSQPRPQQAPQPHVLQRPHPPQPSMPTLPPQPLLHMPPQLMPQTRTHHQQPPYPPQPPPHMPSQRPAPPPANRALPTHQTDNAQAQTVPQAPPVSTPIQPTSVMPHNLSFDRRGKQSADHKQALLSLFSKPSTVVLPTAAEPAPAPSNPLTNLTLRDINKPENERSQAGSAASKATDRPGNASTGSRSQTPISPVNKGFLLGYLEGVARGH